MTLITTPRGASLKRLRPRAGHGDFKLAGNYSAKLVEEAVLKFWESAGIPQRWRRWDSPRVFSFLEGPPTTNGMPHVGHLRGRTYKDAVLRFKRLQGYSVWAQGGWDTQGLPVELEVEKRLGLRSKKEIEAYGADRFARACNDLVDEYLAQWREWGTRRLGLWLDLEGAYETRRPQYIEYAWRLIKRAHGLGLLAEDYRVLWFCPRCETSLSDHEVDLGYEEREDPSIYVKFPVEGGEGEYLVIWTTTPWTLVDNEAVAVHPDHEYSLVEVEWRGSVERWWLASALAPKLLEQFGVRARRVAEVRRGSQLAGTRYLHPLAGEVPERATRPHVVVAADFVTLDQGTGLVHIAPGHGPEDFELAQRAGLKVTNSVEVNGMYNELGGKYAGKHVFDVDVEVVKDLDAKGLLVKADKVRHEYPHCWRCGTKLILRADRQWFIRMSRLRDAMYEELRRVEVVPEKLRDRFDTFVRNAKDWNISRSRIWGTPLPIWRCGDRVMVVGSLEELKRVASRLPPVDDFWLVHRPWIDQVEISTPDCPRWVREPYVADVWMDSGIAWIAAVDGERNELWRSLYPYSFVTEGLDQTRGWFYSLLATSVVYTGRAPYRRILIQGLILDKEGQKMSKSKGNVVWARELLQTYGADPVRLYILSKAAPWEALAFDPEEVRHVASQLNVVWNVFKFADTYMRLDGFSPDRYPLERWLDKALDEDLWLLAEFRGALEAVEHHMEALELHRAASAWLEFAVDVLSHRYLRLLRRRVWSEEPREDKYAAYAVLYHVLKGLLIAGSPMVPFFAEYLWQAFVRRHEPAAPESVHLARWPSVPDVGSHLVPAFRELFQAFSAVAEARNRAGIKLRWPVAEVRIQGAEHAGKYAELLRYLANAKAVLEGPCPQGYVAASEGEVTACIPPGLDEGLYLEALAREVVRRVQVTRKEAGLDVADWVRLYIGTDSKDLERAVEAHRDYIASETRAVEVRLERRAGAREWEVEGARLWIALERA